MKKSLFERIGGVPALRLIVDRFYSKIIQDESISHFFEKSDINALKSKQIAFLSYAFGAPYANDVERMMKAHAHLNIKVEHFQTVANHLENTLEEINMKPEFREEVMKIVASFEKGIVSAN